NLRVIHRVAAANRGAAVTAGLPGKADARLEVLRRGRQGLTIVAETEIKREVRQHVKTVLHKSGDQPLTQFIVANSEIDWLRVILHIGQRQLIERLGAAGS